MLTLTVFNQAVALMRDVLDAIGILVVLIGTVMAFVHYVARADRTLRHFRQEFGQAVLVGLEFLVAGTVIRSVVVAPSLDNTLALGMIVLIRAFLSAILALEMSSQGPWRAAAPPPQRE